MELGHLLTRSGLTYLEVSSEVYHDFFCQLGSSEENVMTCKYQYIGLGSLRDPTWRTGEGTDTATSLNFLAVCLCVKMPDDGLIN